MTGNEGSVSGRILVIDDEDILRRTLARVLHKAGYDVAMAGDGHEALRLLGANEFDLVYLDIRLPGMDGLQILKSIRKSDTKMPVILLTAYGSLQTALEALRLGAADYLLKPIDPEVLVARTHIILDELAVERRMQEIRKQIASLQQELRSLEARKNGEASPQETLAAPEDRFIKRGPLIIDIQTRRATLRDRVLALSPAAFDYLLVLARHAPDVVTYQALVSEAQGYHTQVVEARELAKWHVHAVRQALENSPAELYHLVNVRGVGYRLVLDS